MIAGASNWVDFSAVKRAVSLETVLGHYQVDRVVVVINCKVVARFIRAGATTRSAPT